MRCSGRAKDGESLQRSFEGSDAEGEHTSMGDGTGVDCKDEASAVHACDTISDSSPSLCRFLKMLSKARIEFSVVKLR